MKHPCLGCGILIDEGERCAFCAELEADRKARLAAVAHLPIIYHCFLHPTKGERKGRRIYVLLAKQGKETVEEHQVTFSWTSSPGENPFVRDFHDQKWACDCGKEAPCIHIETVKAWRKAQNKAARAQRAAMELQAKDEAPQPSKDLAEHNRLIREERAARKRAESRDAEFNRLKTLEAAKPPAPRPEERTVDGVLVIHAEPYRLPADPDHCEHWDRVLSMCGARGLDCPYKHHFINCHKNPVAPEHML